MQRRKNGNRTEIIHDLENNFKQNNILKLKQLFPEVFCEGQIDFEKLKLVLGAENLAGAGERYQLDWAGKTAAYLNLQSPTSRTLVPCKEESADFDGTQNVFIEAENLEALKILQKSYAGSVKMIYIDPPYNTGNDSFIYPDKFSESREEYARRVGDTDDAGYLKRDGVFQGAWRKNGKDSGHYHSNWLSMMLPRLHLAKTLLREDGVIFISIDDNEQAQLKLLCDEVFGAENFVSEIVWKKKTGSGTKIKNVFDEHEYLVIYAKDKSNLAEWRYSDESHGNFSNPDDDRRGAWESCALTAPSKNKNPNQLYGIRVFFEYNFSKNELEKFEEDSNILYAFNYLNHAVILEKTEDFTLTNYDKEKKEGFFVRRWAYIPSSMKNDVFETNRVYFNNGNIPRYKKFETEYAGKALPSIYYDEFSTQQGTAALANRLQDGLLEYPKPVELLKFFIKNITQENDLIMDFFAGSGTTADAVFQLNSDSLFRKFICIQIPEELNPKNENQKAAFNFCQSLGIPENIAEIAKERIRRAGRQISDGLQDGSKIDTGFKVFKLAESGFKQWRQPGQADTEALQRELSLNIDSVLSETSSENLLYELMLRMGLKLTCKVSFSDDVYFVEDEDTGGLYAFLLERVDQGLIDAVLEKHPVKVAVLDRLFEDDDALKSNTVLQMKDAGVMFECV